MDRLTAPRSNLQVNATMHGNTYLHLRHLSRRHLGRLLEFDLGTPSPRFSVWALDWLTNRWCCASRRPERVGRQPSACEVNRYWDAGCQYTPHIEGGPIMQVYDA